MKTTKKLPHNRTTPKDQYKNKPGRLNTFEFKKITTEQLELKVNEYFDSNEALRTLTQYQNGKEFKKALKVYTLPGLCYFLGVESRETFSRLMHGKSEYAAILKKAFTRIQMFMEEQSVISNPAGPIFLLKNLGYTDNTTVNSLSTDGSMTPKPTIINHSKETGENRTDSGSEVKKLVRELELAEVN